MEIRENCIKRVIFRVCIDRFIQKKVEIGLCDWKILQKNR